jgi:hypothetical protein
MKLKCTEHKRRVMVLELEDRDKTIHRSDGSICTSRELTIGPALMYPESVSRLNRQDEHFKVTGGQLA